MKNEESYEETKKTEENDDTSDKKYTDFKTKYNALMLQYIPIVAHNSSINDIKQEYPVGYNKLKCK